MWDQFIGHDHLRLGALVCLIPPTWNNGFTLVSRGSDVIAFFRGPVRFHNNLGARFGHIPPVGIPPVHPHALFPDPSPNWRPVCLEWPQIPSDSHFGERDQKGVKVTFKNVTKY